MSRRVANRIHRLDEFPSYKGGHTCLVGRYVFEFAPTHHLANGWGWVAQHRLVGESIAGRPLRRSKDPKIAECVHHIDRCTTNNDPSNLQVMTRSAHQTMHMLEIGAANLAKITPHQVRQSLICRTIKEAAAALGVHHQTLRNRFPELIAHRKRASPSRHDDPQTAERIRPYAESREYGVRDASIATKIADATIIRCCRHFGIPWTHKRRPGRPPKTIPFRKKARVNKTAPDGRSRPRPRVLL